MPKSKEFKKLLKVTKKYYTGKKVPKEFEKKYGKIYSEKEAEEIGFAIATKIGIKK